MKGKPKRLPILVSFIACLGLYAVAIWITLFGLDVYLTSGQKYLFLETKALLSNIFVSFIFYYLVVYLPVERKRQVLRSNCKKMYRETKRQILLDIVSGSMRGGRADIDMTDIGALMTPDGFRKAFEGGREADEGFYAFTNFIMRDEEAFRSIVFKFKLIARQLEYILQNVQLDDEVVFQKLKRIEEGYSNWTTFVLITIK